MTDRLSQFEACEACGGDPAACPATNCHMLTGPQPELDVDPDWEVSFKRCRGLDCSLAEGHMWHGYCSRCAAVEKTRAQIVSKLRQWGYDGAAEHAEAMEIYL